jgi:type II secretory pathway pseudopilin PulG
MSSGCTIALVVVLVGFVAVAVLAAIAVPIGRMFLQKARTLQTKAMMQGLVLAINAYRTEYSRLPIYGETDELKTLPVEGEMLDVLMGKHPAKNPRSISFYSPPLHKPRGKGGLVINAAGLPELQDLYGNVYHMRFDWNGDGNIPDPEHPGAAVRGTVILYSAGPDGDYSTWHDNIMSWR